MLEAGPMQNVCVVVVKACRWDRCAWTVAHATSEFLPRFRAAVSTKLPFMDMLDEGTAELHFSPGF